MLECKKIKIKKNDRTTRKNIVFFITIKCFQVATAFHVIFNVATVATVAVRN